MFKMPNAVKIMGRSSTITNSFVNSIIPLFHPTDEEVTEALSVLGMTSATMACAYCGDRASEWDHLRPLVKGKRPTGYVSEIANLVPACGKCNQSKGASYWMDWMLGSAKQSPFTRSISDLEARVERLQDYEKWRVPRRVDFEALAGDELWQRHWRNHARLMELMSECQETAEEIRLVVKSASSLMPSQSEVAAAKSRTKPGAEPIIQNRVPVTTISKRDAISRVGVPGALISANTHFANINVAKDVWWLDVPLWKIDAGAYAEVDLLLFDGRHDVLHHLRVPADYLRANIDHLNVRMDKKCVHLELKANDPNKFQNVTPITSGIGFAQFVVRLS